MTKPVRKLKKILVKSENNNENNHFSSLNHIKDKV